MIHRRWLLTNKTNSTIKMSCVNGETHINSVIGGRKDPEDDQSIMLSLGLVPREVPQVPLFCRLCQKHSDTPMTRISNELQEAYHGSIAELSGDSNVDAFACSICLENLKKLENLQNEITSNTPPVKAEVIVINDSYVDKRAIVSDRSFKVEPDSEGQISMECENDTVVRCSLEDGTKIVSKNEEDEETCINPMDVCETTQYIPNPKLYKCRKCDFSSMDIKKYKYHLLSHKGRKMYECDHCDFFTPHHNVMDCHKLKHVSEEHAVWYHCEKCTYKTKYAFNKDKHGLTHLADEQKKFKCEHCPYRSNWKRDLDRHLIKHQNPAEVTYHNCHICAFKTKHARYLKSHIQKVHIGEQIPDQTFKCAHCNFSSKLKRSLIPHMLTHRNPEDVASFRCELCTYSSKSKNLLKRHMLRHTKVFHCNLCDFKTNLKRYLVEHFQNHTTPDKFPEYTCDYCSFKSRWKNNVDKHMLTHKRPDQVEMFKCPHCDHKTKRKTDLNHHIKMMHAENVKIYSCNQCSYQTKYRTNFKNHTNFVHGSETDTVIYSCDKCSFKTKYRMSIVNHKMIHNKGMPGQVTYKCNSCSYKTPKKECLNKHLVKHKSIEEVETFQCAQCSYISKYKRSLVKHVQTHMTDSERRSKMFSCGICDFKCLSKKTFQKHEQNAHEDSKLEITIEETALT